MLLLRKELLCCFFFSLRNGILCSNKYYDPVSFTDSYFRQAYLSQKGNHTFPFIGVPCPFLGFCKLKSSLAGNAPDLFDPPQTCISSKKTLSLQFGRTCSSAHTQYTQRTTAEHGSLFSDVRLFAHTHCAVMFAFTGEQASSAYDCKAFTCNLSLKFHERQTTSETLS